MTGTTKFVLVGSALLAGMGSAAALMFWNVLAGEASQARPLVIPVNQEEVRLRRGAYLMLTLDCNACHSPRDEKGQPIPGREMTGHPEGAPLPEWDPSMLEKDILMTMNPTGTAFAGPWGISIAPNLTPDKETGIGRMTADDLIRSWRTNTHWRINRPVMPPMPVPAYSSLTEDDIRALYAYLMSQPPVKNKAPESKVAAPPPGTRH